MLQMTLQNKILCASFGVFLILYYYVSRHTSSEKPRASANEAASADTYIPAGHVLVPIQIENSESLNAVMGPFAVVDLYSSASGHNTLVAEKVKLIRAPLNPQQYAVLVSDSMSRTIMQFKSSFSVVLQNRTVFKADLEKNLLADEDQKLPSSPKSRTVPEPAEKSQYPGTSRPQLKIEYQQKKIL